jgi:hypothetical protein
MSSTSVVDSLARAAGQSKSRQYSWALFLGTANNKDVTPRWEHATTYRSGRLVAEFVSTGPGRIRASARPAAGNAARIVHLAQPHSDPRGAATASVTVVVARIAVERLPKVMVALAITEILRLESC